MSETIAQRIAVLRDRKFLSTVELAERAGINASNLYLILAGSTPRRSTIRKLATALDVSPHELAGLPTDAATPAI